MVTITPAAGLHITSGVPPNGTVGVYYNHGNGVTCEFVGGYCHPCYLAASTRVCGADWVYQNSFVFRAAGGTPGYTWAAVGLPPGLSISADGKFSFSQHCCSPNSAGTYSAVVTVTDSASPAALVSATYSIVIAPPPPPVISTSPPPAGGTLNSPYQFTFTVASGGFAPFKWTETGALPSGLSFSSSTGALSGTPTAAGPFPIMVQVQDSAGQESGLQRFLIEVSLHGFKATGSMAAERTAHTATLLSNGSVLVAGGYGDAGGLLTAELYDPNSGTFKLTGSMQTGRFSHTATLLSPLLPNGGKVLVAGGGNGIANAELYDPSSGVFTATGSMNTARWIQTATLLKDGTVLVAGGADTEENPLASAELYDPSSGTFKPTGSMAAARFGHTATSLNDGRVLITGGTGSNGQSIAAAELYDPASHTFKATGSMQVPRYQQTATLLTDGKVLVTGGIVTANPTATAELFDPSSGTFMATASMETPRSFHEATLLSDGTVLVTGGQYAVPLSNAETYDPVSVTFTPTGSMGTPRTAFTSTLLQNGAVLVTGGTGLATAELYH